MVSLGKQGAAHRGVADPFEAGVGAPNRARDAVIKFLIVPVDVEIFEVGEAAEDADLLPPQPKRNDVQLRPRAVPADGGAGASGRAAKKAKGAPRAAKGARGAAATAGAGAGAGQKKKRRRVGYDLDEAEETPPDPDFEDPEEEDIFAVPIEDADAETEDVVPAGGGRPARGAKVATVRRRRGVITEASDDDREDDA